MAKPRISEETVHQALQALSFRKRHVRKHSQETMKLALQELKEGAGIRVTARKYGIPKSTLMDRRDGRHSNGPHPNRALLPAEEEALVNYIFWMAEHGFPVSQKVALLLATEVCKVSGRVNPFVNLEQGLSKMWWKRFKARHPKIACRRPSYLEVERYHGATGERVDELFRICQELYDKHGFHTAPELIYNCDETGFGENKGSPQKKVLCVKGQKTLYAKQVTSKEHITVHCCVNAAGESIPPFVIFQKCLPSNSYSLDGPPNALYGFSDTGYMDAELFLKWLQHFVKHARKERPVVLFMDQHDVHVGTGVVDFCRANQVEVVCLPSHTTHVLQPLDVSVYGPLKTAFNEMASVLGLVRGNMIIGKRNFTPVLRAALEKAVTPQNIQSGFRKTGLYPLDRQAVDQAKLVKRGFKRKLFDGNDNPALPTPGEGATASTSASAHNTTAADGTNVTDTTVNSTHHKAKERAKTKAKPPAKPKGKEPSKGKGKGKNQEKRKSRSKDHDKRKSRSKDHDKRKSRSKDHDKRKSRSKDSAKGKSRSKDSAKGKSRSKVPAKRKRKAESPSSTSPSSCSYSSNSCNSSYSSSTSSSRSPSPRRPATCTIAIQTPWAPPDSPTTVPNSAFTCSTNSAFPYVATNFDFPTTITTGAAAGTSVNPTTDAAADITTTTTTDAAADITTTTTTTTDAAADITTTTTDAAADITTTTTDAAADITTTTTTDAAADITTTTTDAAAVDTFNTESCINTEASLTTTTSTTDAGTSNTSTAAADNYNSTIADAAVDTSIPTAADNTSTADHLYCSTTTTTTTVAVANTTPPATPCSTVPPTTPCSTAPPTTPCSTALPTTPCSTTAAGTAWSTPTTPATPCSPGQCPTCRRQPNPLVSAGMIPPSLADILLPPQFDKPARPRGKRILLPARVITSEEHAALLEQQKQEEVRKQQDKLDRAKERAEERVMLREMRQEMKRQEKLKEKEARQQQREELARERAAAKQAASAAMKVARAGARRQKLTAQLEEEEEETREVRQASAWAAQETQEVDRDRDREGGSQNAVQEEYMDNGSQSLQGAVHDSQEGDRGMGHRGQNSAVQSSQERRGQNRAVQSSQERRGQNRAVQSSQERRGQNRAVQSSQERRGQNRAVQSSQERRVQNSAVQSSQERRVQNSAVQSSQERRGQNRAVQSSQERRGQNSAVLCAKCGEGGSGLFFQSPCCDLWYHANCVNVTMVTEMQLMVDVEDM